jgi:anti-sigma B factor antagonist
VGTAVAGRARGGRTRKEDRSVSLLADSFQVAVTTNGGRTLVHPQGELDVSTSSRFRECLNEIMDAGVTEVAVNLKDVSFIDSAGLGVLVGALKRLQGVDGRLRLVAPSRGVRKVLEITGLTALVEVL